MAETLKIAPPRDFTLKFFSEQSSQEEVRLALRKKWHWVVFAIGQNALWYSLLISNLHQSSRFTQNATVDTVREALAVGMQRSAFDRLKLLTQTSREELGRAVQISSRTLSRREIFGPDESERILRVAAVFQRSIEVFEDLAASRHWFAAPKAVLGGKSPLQFCDTEIGADEVIHLLGRMEQGVFS